MIDHHLRVIDFQHVRCQQGSFPLAAAAPVDDDPALFGSVMEAIRF
jgi:hypothetical protein